MTLGRGSTLLALLVGAALTALPAAAEQIAFDRAELWIDTGEARQRFTVEVAATPEQRAFGLMFRAELAADAGMLFDFGRDAPVAMWMKNTLIPLDMLFVTSDGRIRRIAANATPLSLDPIESGGPVRAVIELGGGTAERLDIEPGDRVRHELFGTR